MAEILPFPRKGQSDDPDFPGIPELAQYHDDGGKARIRRHRVMVGLDRAFHGSTMRDDDLTMEHADPEDTRPSELA